MKKLFSSLLLLLAVFSLASSSSEVSAAVAPSGYAISANLVAPAGDPFDALSPSDELIDHMLQQVADVDPRFNNLSKYESLTYFMTVDTYRTVTDSVPGWQRRVSGSYKFYIIPYLEGSPDALKASLDANAAGPVTAADYYGYNYSDIGDSTIDLKRIKNAWFASDWSADREAHVYGYTFDMDGTLNQPISSSSGGRLFWITPKNPMQNTTDNNPIVYVVRGNMVNMPMYYRIPALDADSLDGDGGSGGNGSSGGDDSGFWNNFVFLFTGIFESLWNDIVGFFSPIVDFFVGIWDWFVDLFKFLFIPSEEFMEKMMTSWNDWMRSTFGALYEAVDIGLDMLGIMYKNVFQGDTIIHLGALFGGKAFIDYGVVERELPSLFALLQLILRFTTGWAVLRSAIYLLVAIASDRKIM